MNEQHVPADQATETAMQSRARKAILESGDWLTSDEIANLTGLSASQLGGWKKQGLIFAINHLGIVYFPDYALDHHAGFRPVKALAKILAIFEGQKDGWGIAYWFGSSNSFLGGQRPQDLLTSGADRVIAAAEDEVQGIRHG